jgi:hypothetical protein
LLIADDTGNAVWRVSAAAAAAVPGGPNNANVSSTAPDTSGFVAASGATVPAKP